MNPLAFFASHSASATSSLFAFPCAYLCHFDRISASLVRQQVPDSVATSDSEQSQLSVAPMIPHELQHRRRVGTRQPFRFGHHALPEPPFA
jgi:hypothetical protein